MLLIIGRKFIYRYMHWLYITQKYILCWLQIRVLVSLRYFLKNLKHTVPEQIELYLIQNPMLYAYKNYV